MAEKKTITRRARRRRPRPVDPVAAEDAARALERRTEAMLDAAVDLRTAYRAWRKATAR